MIARIRKINDKEEKLSGMEASISSLQKGNKYSEKSVILQKLCHFPMFVTFLVFCSDYP